MFANLKYVQSLKKEVDELQTDKNEFSKEYDLLLQECVSKDIMCSILRTFESLDEKTEMQCLYLEKHEECDNLEIELSKTKKPKVVAISARKPTNQANQSVATLHKKTVASESTI
ncbi:hypothetical protein Tco_1417577 [Tanacetum coccineum]